VTSLWSMSWNSRSYQYHTVDSEEDGMSRHGRAQTKPSWALKAFIAMAACTLLGMAYFVGVHHSGLFSSSSSSLPLQLNADDDMEKICLHEDFTKNMLKTAKDQSIIALFKDPRDQEEFEASDVVRVDDHYYIVFDNFFAIGKVAYNLPLQSTENRLIGPMTPKSEYEGIAYNPLNKHFYLAREAVIAHPEHFHAVIQEVKLTTNDDGEERIEIIKECASMPEFNNGNKGYEGLAGLVAADGAFRLLGLCEGNHCEGGKRGRDRGHGRLNLFQHHPVAEPGSDRSAGGCVWNISKAIHVPQEADFLDYSAVTVHDDGDAPRSYKIAISSQEDAKLWVGRIDTKKWELSTTGVYHFPRNDHCQIKYCNIEGVYFLNEDMVVGVSDQMKNKGRQSFRCMEKDQSMHIFVLPKQK